MTRLFRHFICLTLIFGAHVSFAETLLIDINQGFPSRRAIAIQGTKSLVVHGHVNLVVLRPSPSDELRFHAISLIGEVAKGGHAAQIEVEDGPDRIDVYVKRAAGVHVTPLTTLSIEVPEAHIGDVEVTNSGSIDVADLNQKTSGDRSLYLQSNFGQVKVRNTEASKGLVVYTVDHPPERRESTSYLGAPLVDKLDACRLSFSP